VRRRDALPRRSKKVEAAQAEVTKYSDLMYAEGCFRHSYNVTSVLWRLGLSWWEDVTPLCTQAHRLRGPNLRRFRQMVAQAELKLPSKEELEAKQATVTESGEDSLDAWHRYYREKRDQLLAFLDQAIALNTYIYCSL